MKISKSNVYFVIAMALYAIASTMEYNDLVHIEAQVKTQGAK